MYLSPLSVELLVRERQESLMEEANRLRIRRAVRPGKTGPKKRLSERLGDLLICAGQRLKNQHAPRLKGNLGRRNA